MLDENILQLATEVYIELSITEATQYTLTAVASLLESENLKISDLIKTDTMEVVQTFIVETLIYNEIVNGFRNKETGELE